MSSSATRLTEDAARRRLAAAKGSGAPSQRPRAKALSLALAIASLALALFAAPASAVQSQVVFDFFGQTGSAAGQFAKGVEEPWVTLSAFPGKFDPGPSGLAVNDDNGDIFVADRLNNRVQQFEVDHDFVRAWGVDVIPGGATGTGTLTNESKEVTSVVTTSKSFIAGQVVTGAGIPPGTTIVSVTTGAGVASKLVLSNKATASTAGVALTTAEGTGNLAQNEKQTISVNATAGAYKLQFATTMPTAEETTAATIAFNAPASSVEAAIASLANVGAGNVEVTGAAGGPYTVEFKGKYADTNVAALTVASSTLTGPGKIFFETKQEGAGRFEKCTLATTCQAGAPSGVGGGMNKPTGVAFHQANDNIYVADSGNLRVNQYDATGTFVRSWGANVVESGPDNKLESQSLKVLASSGTFVLSFENSSSVSDKTTATGTGTYASGANEITSVTTSSGAFTVGKQIRGEGIPSGTKITAVEPGKLTISENTTEAKADTALVADLPYDASAATVEAALNALSTIGGELGSVTVTGGPGDATGSSPYQVAFGGSLVNTDANQIALDAAGLGQPAGTVLPCTGGPTAAPAPTLTYQWLANGAPIAGATGASYTIQAADAGKAIQCKVKATNSDGATLKTNTPPVVASPAPVLLPPAPPNNAPTLSVTTPSDGGFTVGNTLTCEPGTWTQSPTFAYKWFRNGVEIAGATADTYTLVAADNQRAIQCEVTATNASGVAVGYAEARIPRTEPPRNEGTNAAVPKITGTASVGSVLTCANGTWTQTPPAAAPAFTYQWLRNSAEIAGATASTYTTVAADAGTAIQCKVIGTLAASGAGAAVSGNTVIAPVPSPTPPVRPAAVASISGSANVGQTLTCSSNPWSPAPAPALTFKWLRNGLPIAGATASTYTVVAADLDKQVQCQVIATNGSGASTAISASFPSSTTLVAPPSASASLAMPSVATTTAQGATAEICEAGTDVCRAGISPVEANRVGGTFVSGPGLNNRASIAPGGPYAGDVFVGDGGGQRMQIFNPTTGAFVAAFGRDVLRSGTETFGKNVCIAALGNVCKGGTGSNAANSYGFSSGSINSGSAVVNDSRPSVFAIDGSGAIYVSGQFGNFLQKYSPNLATEQDFAPDICTPAKGLVEGCDQVAVDPATNDVYVVRGVRFDFSFCFGTICNILPERKESAMVRLDPTGTQAPIERMLEGAGIQHINGFAVDGSTGNERSGRVYFTTGTPEQRVDILGFAMQPDLVFDPIEAADVGPHGVTVHGSVNPNGDKIDTSYQFETLIQGGVWTPFPASPVNLGKGTSPVAVAQTITGLRANTKYKVRLVAIKGGQRTVGPEQQFTTLQSGPDVITGGASWSGPPSSGPSLTFSGTVDDNNLPVHYYFEYGTDASYGPRVPIFETGSHPASQLAFLGRQTVNGLDPSGTYHYRIVGKTSSGTSFGADQEVGPAQANVAYPEMVSPVEKGVGVVDKGIIGFVNQEDNQAAANGERFAYVFEYGAPDATAGGEILDLATREPSGWTTTQFAPPSTVPPSVNAYGVAQQGSQGEVRWMSPEIDCSFVQSRAKVNAETPAADVENLIKHLYLREEDGSFRMITPSPLNSNALTVVTGSGGQGEFKIRGGAADCSRVIFNTGWQLLPGMPVNEALHVYEWEDTGGSGTLRVVDVLPDGSIPSTGGTPAQQTTELNAVSQPDASRTFFVATSNEGGDSGQKALFIRKNHSVTVDVSQSQTAVANNAATTFQMASVDGSHAFFTAKAGLASNSTTTTGNSLYDYNVDTGVLRDLTPNTNAANTAGSAIDGVMGASDNGSYVYFGAKGQLVTGQGKTYAQNNTGKEDNVYVAHNGTPAYVGGIKEANWLSDFIANGSTGTTSSRGPRVTPDGKYLLFKSGLNLTSYDSKGTSEYYRYSVAGPALDCVSCLPGGPSANGKDEIFAGGGESTRIADIYVSRALATDGSRVFFNYRVTEETVGNSVTKSTPYEWHNGVLTKLAKEGSFIDASVDGQDVFISTREPLVPVDQDSATDIYDFRLNGGFPYFPPEPCDPLTENSCQGTPPAPPAATADPASGTFNGAGNPPGGKPKPRRCKKGQVRRKGKCVKHGQSHRHKRAAKHNRGGAK